MDEIFDLLDAAAKQHPMKKLASTLGKAESTLRNELSRQDGYKLGLVCAIQIMKTTKDLSALDRIEELFGRVVHTLPPPQTSNPGRLMRMHGEHSVSYGQTVQKYGQAIEDGVFTKKEIETWLEDLRETNKRGMELQSNLESYLKRL